jgi:hypothetical protein
VHVVVSSSNALVSSCMHNVFMHMCCSPTAAGYLGHNRSADNYVHCTGALAGAAVAAAAEAMNSLYCHYEPYWVEGLPTTAAGLTAAITAACMPLRAVVWLHPHTTGSNLAAGLGSTAQDGAVGGAQKQSEPALPEELTKLQTAIAAAPWDSALAGLLLLPLPVGDASSTFTAVPQTGTIANPPWAAASSAAAAMRAALTAATAAEPQQMSASGGKPASAKPGQSSSGGTVGTAGKAAGAAAGGAATGAAGSAAAAAPEEVMGCKELARALLSVGNHAKVYDQWRAAVRVYRMPAPGSSSSSSSSVGSSMNGYRQLLSNVPQERQSVPVVLHAMLEQVSSQSHSNT